MSCWPKHSQPHASPLGCHGLVAGRRNSGHAWGDGQGATCRLCHWWELVGQEGSGREWLRCLLASAVVAGGGSPSPSPCIAAAGDEHRAAASPGGGSSAEIVPKRGFNDQPHYLKVTRKGTVGFSSPSQHSSHWMLMPTLPTAGLLHWDLPRDQGCPAPQGLFPLIPVCCFSTAGTVLGTKHTGSRGAWETTGKRNSYVGTETRSRCPSCSATGKLWGWGDSSQVAPTHLCKKVYPGTSG